MIRFCFQTELEEKEGKILRLENNKHSLQEIKEEHLFLKSCFNR